MTDLTGNKDVDLLIFEKLDDRTLFQYCEIGKDDDYVKKLCNDEHFWLKRLQKTFGDVQKNPKKTWKNLYLSLVYYTEKYPVGQPNLPIYEMAVNNDVEVLNYYIMKGFKNWNTALTDAVKAGNVAMVKHFLPLAQSDNLPFLLLIIAIQLGNIEIVKLVLPKIDLQDFIRTQGFTFLFLPPAENGRLDFLRFIFPLIKIKERDLLFLIEQFSLSPDFRISSQQAKNVFLFLADTYLSIGGKKKKLKQTIKLILYEDVKNQEYAKFLKNYMKKNFK